MFRLAPAYLQLVLDIPQLSETEVDSGSIPESELWDKGPAPARIIDRNKHDHSFKRALRWARWTAPRGSQEQSFSPSLLTTSPMSSTIVIVFLCASYALYSLLCLIRNIRIAKNIGIPVVWSPISPFNPFWIIFNKRLSPIIQRLPLSLGSWTQHDALDWTWVDRAHGDSQVHEKLGDTFAHATPREIEIHTRDPAVADEVLRKRANEFPKISHYASKLHPDFLKVSSKRCLLTTIITEVLDFLGMSLVSSDGEDWVRHRRATVSTLSDRNNRLVWTETVRQTQQMIQHYFSASSGRIIDPVEDVREVYLHVFTGVCFGVKYDFRQAAEKYIPQGHARSYKDCLHTSLKDLLILRLVPKWILDLPVLPHRISNFRDSAREMRRYLDEMIASSKEELEEKGTRRRTRTDNLLSFMVKSNGEMETENASSDVSLKRNYLTESEIRGNLFTYSLGGHESSAHTLTFALYLLAALPQEQEWLAAEVTSVLGQKKDWQSEESFMEVFARLKRCQAVMVSATTELACLIWAHRVNLERNLTALSISHCAAEMHRFRVYDTSRQRERSTYSAKYQCLR